LRASCGAANLLAKENKLFSDGELVRKRLKQIVQEICPEKDTIFITVIFFSCNNDAMS
jgi:hypothetical protein